MMQLGELVTVPLREGWPHVSQHFTPWLVENLDRLSRALGLGLEFRAKEHPVGRFYLDILAIDGAGRTVAIENQFGPTDHDHLGKLLGDSPPAPNFHVFARPNTLTKVTRPQTSAKVAWS